jgi:hypothetical protein
MAPAPCTIGASGSSADALAAGASLCANASNGTTVDNHASNAKGCKRKTDIMFQVLARLIDARHATDADCRQEQRDDVSIAKCKDKSTANIKFERKCSFEFF